MPLMSVSRPQDQSLANIIAGEAISVTAKDKVKNKGNRFRISDTSGNLTAKKLKAGGEGSGRKKEVEKYLKSQGFERHKVYGTRNGDDKGGNSHWSKTYDKNVHGTHDNTGSVNHAVMVKPDGSWMHSVTGNHHGGASDISHLNLSARADMNSIEGNTLQSLKTILAKSFKQGERKKLAKKKEAEPDGSFPIRNKQDLSNAKRDLGRAGNKASDRAWINKRAKELNAPKIGASSKKCIACGKSPCECEDMYKGKKMKSRNASSIEYYSKGKVKAGGEGSGRKAMLNRMADRLAKFTSNPKNNPDINKKLGEFFDKHNKKIFSSSKPFKVRCSTGTMSIKAGGPGSGRHITVTTGNNKERIAMHKGLVSKGFSMQVKFGQDGDRTHTYTHSNGDKVTMHYVPGRDNPAYSKGKETGQKLGNMLRQALEKKVSKAIQIAK